jgi:hypothetical protein
MLWVWEYLRGSALQIANQSLRSATTGFIAAAL